MVKIPLPVLVILPKDPPKIVPTVPEVPVSKPAASVPPDREPPASAMFPNGKLWPDSATLPSICSVPVLESEPPERNVALTPLWMSKSGVKTGACTFNVSVPEVPLAITEVPAFTMASTVKVPVPVGCSLISE